MPDHIKPELGKFIMGKLNEWFKRNGSTVQYVEDSQVENTKKSTSFKPLKEGGEKDSRNKRISSGSPMDAPVVDKTPALVPSTFKM